MKNNPDYFIPTPSRMPRGLAAGIKGDFKSFSPGSMPREKARGFILPSFLGLLGLGLAFVAFWPAASRAATLSLSPASGSFSPGSSFTVSIMLDTSGAAIQGTDVYRLNYDPALLEVYDADASQSGVQITPGNLMPITAMNSVDVSSGKILFSQIAVGAATFTGSGTLAQVRFRVKAAGAANLTFDFSQGSTSDTNVSSSGQDVLSSVANGSYNLISSGAASTPAPRPSSPATPARPTPPAGLFPSPIISPQVLEPAPEPMLPAGQKFFSKIFVEQDVEILFFAAVIVILAVVITGITYALVSNRTAVGNTARENRIKHIADLIILNLRKRATKSEIEEILAGMRFKQDEINEALKRLKF